MRRTKDRLLLRAIVSHLAVAMPPAFILGYLVVDANRQNLLTEAQQVHLVTAARAAEAITHHFTSRLTALEEAERILDAAQVPFEQRTVFLRAMIAAGRAEALGIYTADGQRDSIVEPVGQTGETGGSVPLPQELPFVARARARVHRFGIAKQGNTFVVVVAWRRKDEVFGFLAAPLSLGPLTQLTQTAADELLAPGGRVDIVDGELAPIMSTTSGPATTTTNGQNPAAVSPFETLGPAGFTPTLDAIRAGYALSYEADDRRYLGAVISVPDLGWLVAASRPENAALGSIERLRSQVGLLAVVSALLAGFVALGLARHITEPIRRLTAAVRQVARNGFRGHVDVSTRSEVRVLQDVFNEVLDQLHRYRRSLRSTTQLRLKIARFLPPTTLHDVLTTEFQVMQGGQRASMSVIYVDLVAGMSLTDVPKEHLVAALCDVYESACGIVDDHGGRIDHFSGDSVIGIFTASDHEEHASVAVKTALSIVKAVDSIVKERETHAPIAMSIGVASGEAVVGRIQETDEVSVVGELVETVIQIQQTASASTVVVSEQTWASLEPELAAQTRVQKTSTLFEEDEL